MKKLLVVIIAAVMVMTALLLPLACSRAPLPAPAPVPAPAPPRPVPAPAPPRPVPAPAVISEKGAAPGAVPALPAERMIVRSGDMALVVKDVIQTRDEIARLATRLEGYVVSSSISGKERELRGNITIRVPDSKFEPALSELRRLAIRVISERTTSQDVTEEYVDLKSRLKNAEATENQYLTLLQKADKVEDILRIYERLAQVRQEIERIKGRIQYLERTSSLSLISVYLEPETAATPTGVWSFVETLKSAIRGLIAFGRLLVIIIIWVLIFIPLWGTIVGVIYWRRRKKKAAS